MHTDGPKDGVHTYLFYEMHTLRTYVY
jgi:hypothetical protein